VWVALGDGYRAGVGGQDSAADVPTDRRISAFEISVEIAMLRSSAYVVSCCLSRCGSVARQATETQVTNASAELLSTSRPV
jgi:hypothetical protein